MTPCRPEALQPNLSVKDDMANEEKKNRGMNRRTERKAVECCCRCHRLPQTHMQKKKLVENDGYKN